MQKTLADAADGMQKEKWQKEKADSNEKQNNNALLQFAEFLIISISGCAPNHGSDGKGNDY